MRVIFAVFCSQLVMCLCYDPGYIPPPPAGHRWGPMKGRPCAGRKGDCGKPPAVIIEKIKMIFTPVIDNLTARVNQTEERIHFLEVENLEIQEELSQLKQSDQELTENFLVLNSSVSDLGLEDAKMRFEIGALNAKDAMTDEAITELRAGSMNNQKVITELLDAVATLNSTFQEDQIEQNQVVESLIVKVNQALATINELEVENAKKQEEIDALKENVSLYGSKKWNQDFCRVFFEGKCFWAVLADRDVTYAQGESLCAVSGSRPATIYSESHYELILEDIASVTEKTRSVWLGLEYEPSTGNTVTLPGRSPAPFLRWLSRYPSSHSSNTGVKLWVSPDPESSSIGMFNNEGRLTGRSSGVLCEF